MGDVFLDIIKLFSNRYIELRVHDMAIQPDQIEYVIVVVELAPNNCLMSTTRHL